MRKQKLVVHAKEYQKKLNELFEQIDYQILDRIVEEIIRVYREDKTIYVAGNGGSAATASHYKLDFGFFVRYFKEKRIKIRSLTDHTPFITAIGNDNSYDEVFTQQMQDYFMQGDVLIVISASGNSKNVINAAKYATQLGGTSIGLVGFEGGKLKDCCDICLYTPNPVGDYGPIEDLHMILNHLIVSYLQKDEEFMNLYN